MSKAKCAACLQVANREPSSVHFKLTVVKFLKSDCKKVRTVHKENNVELSLDKSSLCAVVSSP